MNLRELEYLAAVAELKHFGKAAYKCCVSQPTLSGQIKKLEEELGLVLFERGRKGVMLTTEGEAIAERARKVLAEAHELEEMALSLKDPFSGHLKLGIFPTLSPYLLPYLVKAFKRHLPNIELQFIEDQTHRLENRLAKGELDVLVLALPVFDTAFEIEPLFQENFFLAVPKGDEFSRRKKIKLNDLEGRSLLLLEDGHCLRAQVLDACHSAGANEFSGFRATSMEVLRQMVAAETGITLIPELAIKRDLSTNNLIKYIPFADPQPHRDLGLVWRKESPREELFKKLADIIKLEARKALNG